MSKILTYIRHSKSELSKVIFPTKGQVKQSFIAVLIVVAFIAAFLAIVDAIMGAILSSVLG
jgi:preprotein translocase subunit SecE